jgi:hypothetical protein
MTSEQGDIRRVVKLRKHEGNNVVAHRDVTEAALALERRDPPGIQLIPIEARRNDGVARAERELPDDRELGGNHRNPPAGPIGERHRHAARQQYRALQQIDRSSHDGMSRRQAPLLQPHKHRIARRQPVTQPGAVAPILEIEHLERRIPIDDLRRPGAVERVEEARSGVIDREHDIGPMGQRMRRQGMLHARDSDRRAVPARDARDVENDPIAAARHAKRLPVMPTAAPVRRSTSGEIRHAFDFGRAGP